MTTIKFIQEVPADSDKLGGHSRVASALAAIIREQPTVRTVGLLGRWGSGKSTVINIARSQFADDSLVSGRQIKFFCYDTWIHQSDPQRSTFLERLLCFALDEGFIDQAYFDAEYGKLTGRVEVHDIQTTPTLTGWGIGLAVALAVVPIGMTLSRQSGNWANLGNALSFAPLLILGLSKLWASIVRGTDKKSADKANSTAALFFNKTVDKVRTRITKPLEPSTIEFQRIFSSVMDMAHAGRVSPVIVVDNLDRISAEDAVVMWSSIKSLIDASPMNKGEHAKFKFLVPFDHSSIVAIFNESKSFVDVVATEKAQSFIDKTFDVSLIVGPPIDSDWRDYLSRMLDEAFSDLIDQKSKAQIVKIFECFVDSEAYFSITPRRMNSYVNTLASLWIQWKDKLGIAPQAYYAARKLWDDPALSDVMSNTAIGSALMARLSPEWQIEVAAIHFGVEPRKAMQLILEPELEKVSASAEQDRFITLANIPGFARTLENWISNKKDDPLAGVDPATLLNVAAFSRAASDLSGEWEDISATLRDACSNLNSWSQPTPHARPGVEALRTEDFEPGRPLLQALGAKSNTKLTPGAWLDMVDAVLPAKNPAVLLREVAPPFEGAGYLALLEACGEREWHKTRERLLRRLAPKEHPDAVVGHITVAIPQSSDAAVYNIIRAASEIEFKWNVQKIADTLVEFIADDPEAREKSIEAILLISDDLKEQLTRLVEQGAIVKALQRAEGATPPRALAASVHLLLQAARYRAWGKSQNVASNPEWSALRTLPVPKDEYEQFWLEFISIYKEQTPLNDNAEAVTLRSLLSVSTIYPSYRRLAVDLMAYVADSDDLGRRAYSDTILESVVEIREMLGNDRADKIMKLVSSFEGWPERLIALDDEVFWSAAITRTLVNKERAQILHAEIVNRIGKMDEDDWVSFIATPPVYAGNLCLASAGKLKADAKRPLVGGFERWATAYIAGEQEIGLAAFEFNLLFENLPPRKRKLWSEALAGYFQHGSLDVVTRGISKTASVLAKYAFDKNGSAELLVNSVLLRAIISDDKKLYSEICAGWSGVLEILRKVDANLRDDLIEREEFIKYVATGRGVSPDVVREELK